MAEVGRTKHRGGIVDADLVLRDGTSDLTADELTQAFTMNNGNPTQHIMALYVLVPQVTGSTTLKVTVRCTTTGRKIEVTHTDNFDSATAYPFLACIPLPPTQGTAWNYDLNVGGGSEDFGAVEVYLGLVDNAVVPTA
ncbi:hypothetical protein LCGC14_0423290 [marine sediment metagenome]|uniref:Uncharacterized protein n=1 Tax=marine sediment metagenome TaxID=412755 RepID=A0A0F9VC71_9ZZZZ